MLRLNYSSGSKPRFDRRGTYWLHFNCPFCLKRGYGNDRKTHLGVGLAQDGDVYLKCLRCGFGGLHNGFDGLTIDGMPAYAKIRKRLPPPEVERDWIPLSEVRGVWLDTLDSCRRELGVWRGLTLQELGERGLEVRIGCCTEVALPYRSLREGVEGRLIRRFSTNGPKVLTMGPPGPATFLNALHDNCKVPTVVVEGWADGAAISSEYNAVILLGADQASAGDYTGRTEVVVCLDGDVVGRGKAREFTLGLYREGIPCSIIVLPDGEDPASLGREAMRTYLVNRTKVRTLRDLQILAPLI